MHTPHGHVSAESDARGFIGNCKGFFEISPCWRGKEGLRDSLTTLRMQLNSADWLRVFAMR